MRLGLKRKLKREFQPDKVDEEAIRNSLEIDSAFSEEDKGEAVDTGSISADEMDEL